MTVLREFQEKRSKFVCETGNYPTRFVIDYEKWYALREPYIHHMTKCDPPEDGKTRYEGMEVIRTQDSHGILEFLP